MKIQRLLMSLGCDRGVISYDPKIEKRHLCRVELERELELGPAKESTKSVELEQLGWVGLPNDEAIINVALEVDQIALELFA